MTACTPTLLVTLACILPLCVLGGDWRRGRYGVRPGHLGSVERMPYVETHFNHQGAPQLAREKLPREFTWCSLDARHGNRCTASWNQHIPQYCGSCFAHGTLAMLQDRLKILKGGSDVMLARQTFLNCAPFHNLSAGCDGGDPIDVLRYMKDFGLPDESCMVYNATDHTKYAAMGLTECPDYGKCLNCMPINTPAPGFTTEVCWPVKQPLMYKLSAFGRIEGCGELPMMNEIFHRGPITCSLATPEEFTYGYRGGVYDGPNGTDVDHNVEVVGWGVDHEGVPYWHVRNSWGTFWGEMGFFKVQRGNNQLSLEACDCWYGIPTWDDERHVLDGGEHGTMHGLVAPEGSQQVVRVVGA